MIRTVSLLMVIVVVTGMGGAVPIAGTAAIGSAADDTLRQADDTAPGNASDIPAGARFAGAVGVQGAELEGEVERRTFGIAVAKSATNASKADVVAGQVTSIQERLASLDREKQALEAARENGSVGAAAYNARIAKLTAQAETVKALSQQSETVAAGLPADVLEARGIDVDAIRTLRESASQLTGPEVASIARTIAGPDVGGSVGKALAPDRTDPPGLGSTSPGDVRANASADREEVRSAIEEAERRIEAAEGRIDQAEAQLGEAPDDDATESIERARSLLDEAKAALAGAEGELAEGNDDQALALVLAALDRADRADAHALDALDTLGVEDGDGDRGAGSDRD